MKKWLFLLLSSPSFAIAQEKGIKFEQNLSWQEIRDKAKAENKYIFVDCFTTWCGPCKKMDKEVYPKDSVGDYMNTKFISVKVQMDTSKQDNEGIKKWYTSAHAIQEQYKVMAYPSYLFFNPNGELVHKGIGAIEMSIFILLAAHATNPRQQFYTLLASYQQGKRDYTVMPYLSKQAKSLNDRNLSDQIASDYINNHIDKIEGTNLYSKENLDFLSSFISVLHSNNKIFGLCLHYPDKIDSVEYKGYSNNVVNSVINQEEITPIINAAKSGDPDPNWKKITRIISRKYGESYAEHNVVQAKVGWYEYKKDWKNYAKYIVERVEGNGPEKVQASMGGVIYFNNNAFEVFKYSKDKEELEKALSWVDRALPMIPNPPITVIDTKANLLYKLGRKTDGIALEEKAAALAPNDKDIQTGFEKMKKGLPTWPSEL